MWLHARRAWICLAFLVPVIVAAQTPRASFSISCDTDCTWTTDDGQHGTQTKGQVSRLSLPLGKHTLEVTSSSGKHWVKKFDITEPRDEQVSVTFAASSPSGDQTPLNAERSTGTVEPTEGLPVFHAEARQVVVRASVHKDEKELSKQERNTWDAHSSGCEEPKYPKRGLAVRDFHIFENGVEQRINYFKESDQLPWTDVSERWLFKAGSQGTWGMDARTKSVKFR